MKEGLPVHGYKPQSDKKVELVNRNKCLEERILRVLDELKGNYDVDPRWLVIGREQIESGFMAVNRAVFQPGRVQLAEDPDLG